MEAITLAYFNRRDAARPACPGMRAFNEPFEIAAMSAPSLNPSPHSGRSPVDKGLRTPGELTHPARLAPVRVSPQELMDIQLRALADQSEAWVRNWWLLNRDSYDTVDAAADAVTAMLQGQIEYGFARKSENAAINYVVTHRVGSEFAAVTPVELGEETNARGWRTKRAYVRRNLNKAATVEDEVKFLQRYLSHTVMDRARRTVIKNAAQIGARYARVPEPGACFFCLMLASRGPVYRSDQTAILGHDGRRYHPHCRCSVGEVLPGQVLPRSVQELVEFRKTHDSWSAEVWRDLVESGRLTEETGIESVTRRDYLRRMAKARERDSKPWR